MMPDTEGFLCPVIDVERCDDCGACKRVCPILQMAKPNHSANPRVFACWNKEESVRFESASGGTFSALALHVLENGGVVFGAAFDENMVVKHIAVQRKEDLGKLRSSKYVQSDMGQSYIAIRQLLIQGKKVLFSGTPCQVAGLNTYLGKNNEELLTCDMLCHGVPSPQLFSKYVKYVEKLFGARLVSINFRHKHKGWQLASTVAFFKDGRQCVLEGVANSFMYGFINSLSLRSACHRCPYTNVDRSGDITLADFWGIGEFKPFHHGIRNGISLILVNSEKGLDFFEKSSTKLCVEERTLEEAKYKREKLSRPLPTPEKRKPFFADYQRLEYEELAKLHLVDKGMKGLIKRLVPRTWIFYLRKFARKVS
jgi:coenzyme F420-reducing hydrogenase beta subunit